MAHNAATVPLLLARYAGEPRYAALEAELRDGPSSPRPWAVDLRAARAAAEEQLQQAVPSAAHRAVLAGMEQTEPPEAGARLGAAVACGRARAQRVAADARAFNTEPPSLPTVQFLHRLYKDKRIVSRWLTPTPPAVLHSCLCVFFSVYSER